MTVPVFINPTDMRVSASGSGQERPIGVMGQYYLERRPGNAGGLRRFTASDEAEVEFFTEELKTQPAFPPVMIEYQAGWFTPGDDDGPVSLACRSAPVAGVVRIQMVYTPPRSRGRGYGRACVGEVSTQVRAEGNRCMLYADLANPVANALYRDLGYRAVAEALRYDFAAAAEP